MVKVSNEVAYCIKYLPLTSEDIGGDKSDEGVPLEDDSWGECREEHGPHDDLFTADHVEQNGTEKVVVLGEVVRLPVLLWNFERKVSNLYNTPSWQRFAVRATR